MLFQERRKLVDSIAVELTPPGELAGAAISGKSVIIAGESVITYVIIFIKRVIE